MKNASLVLNIILLLAVAYLFIDHFSGGKDAEAATRPAANGAGGPLHIVYINSDSLLAKYDYFRQRQEQLAQKEQTATRGLQARSQELEREIAQAQRQAQSGTLAPKQIQQMQQSLGLKQQELMQDQQQISQELMQETQQLQLELEQKLQEILDGLQAERNYDYILNYGPGTGVLMVNDSLDITNNVLERLNRQQTNGN